MPKISQRPSIPLLCSLCPKTPKFSDISHLLTHISSKGHLAHRFKLQLRAQSEPEARQQLEIFETWYAEYGLEDLLSERLAAKELKGPTKRNRKSSSVAVQSGVIKHEDIPEYATHTTPAFRPAVPRMHLWPTGPNIAGSNHSPSIDPFIQHDVYATPTMLRKIPNFSQFDTPAFGRPEARPDPQASDETEVENDLDISKLKGVYWPGMSLFDSATAEMKRMRNQRKDGTVLAQMRISSAGVAPTEWIFQGDGEFVRSRDIYGPLTDSSPAKTEDTRSAIVPSPNKPSPKKKRRRVTTNEVTVTRRSRGSLNSQPSTRDTVSNKSHKNSTNEMSENKQKKSKATLYKDISEGEQEYNLTMGRAKKPQRLGIYQDSQDISPDRTESPLDDHRFDYFRGSMLQPNNPNTMGHIVPFPFTKPMAMHPGKENMPLETFNSLHMPFGGLPPHTFHDHSFNPLFFQNNMQSFMYHEPNGFENDVKPGQSSFQGDFKPLLIHYSNRGHQGSHTAPTNFNSEETSPFEI